MAAVSKPTRTSAFAARNSAVFVRGGASSSSSSKKKSKKSSNKGSGRAKKAIDSAMKEKDSAKALGDAIR